MKNDIEILKDEEITEEDFEKAREAVRRLAEHDYSSVEESEKLYELVHKVFWEELMDPIDDDDFCDAEDDDPLY